MLLSCYENHLRSNPADGLKMDSDGDAVTLDGRLFQIRGVHGNGNSHSHGIPMGMGVVLGY